MTLTLVKPAAIDTIFMERARNAIEAPGTRNPPLACHPRLVARATLTDAGTERERPVVAPLVADRWR